MNGALRDPLKAELLARGFGANGESPNGTMTVDDQYLAGVEIGNLLDIMVTRREKVLRSQRVVGADVAKRSYDEVVLIIDAIKMVIAAALK
jgi:hypothetical protein